MWTQNEDTMSVGVFRDYNVASLPWKAVIWASQAFGVEVGMHIIREYLDLFIQLLSKLTLLEFRSHHFRYWISSFFHVQDRHTKEKRKKKGKNGSQ